MNVYEVIDTDGWRFMFAATSPEKFQEEWDYDSTGAGDIASFTEIPPERWDEVRVKMYEDNNTELEPFYNTVGELMHGETKAFMLRMPLGFL